MNGIASKSHSSLPHILRAPPPYLAALPMGMYACDTEGWLLWYNERAAQLWGRAPATGPGGARYCGSYRILDGTGGIVAPQDAPMGEALRNGLSIAGREVSIERPDGSRGSAIVHIDIIKDDAGKIAGAINCFQDITDVKERERRFTDILNSLPVAVYTTDKEGRITYFNDAAETLAGRRPAVGVDEWCVSWRLQDANGRHLPHDQCPMAMALKEQRPIRGVRAYAVRPDGTRVPIAPHPTPLKSSAGETIGAVNALVELTELDRANEIITKDTEAMARLNAASSRLWRSSTLVAGLEAILEGSIETMGASLGNVQLLDQGQQILRIAAQRGFKQPFLDFFAEVSAADNSACGRALRACERIVIPDVEVDPDFASMRHVAREAGFRAVQSTPLIGRSGAPLGMLSTHFSDVHTPTAQEFRRLDLYARQAADFIERCYIDDALRRSEAKERARASELEAIMGSVPAAIWIAHDVECRKISGNHTAEKLMGLPPDANHSLSAPEDDRPTHFEIFSKGLKLEVNDLPVQRAARGEEVRDFEMELRFGDGSSRTLLGNANPLFDSHGTTRGSVAAFVDITDRLDAERLRELLVAELSHRVKNTLATVMSLWQHSFAKARSPEAARTSFEARLLALSQAHTRLGEGGWTGVSLRTLIADEIRPYIAEEEDNLDLKGEALTLNPRATLSLGMVFHELATNAAKYGALSHPNGKVGISWGRADNQIRIDWREEGGPAVAQPLRRGFGRFLIERSVVAEFKGTVSLNFEPSGLHCCIGLPLENVLLIDRMRG